MKSIKLNSKQINKFMVWMYDQYMLQGDPWTKWYAEEGMASFHDWVKKHMADRLKEL